MSYMGSIFYKKKNTYTHSDVINTKKMYENAKIVITFIYLLLKIPKKFPLIILHALITGSINIRRELKITQCYKENENIGSIKKNTCKPQKRHQKNRLIRYADEHFRKNII